MSPSIQATDLCKRLGHRTVVDRVSLELRSRRVVGLLGPNGAGKTTVFNMIMGLIAPDSGRVILRHDHGATELCGLPPHRRALLGLGYLPQTPSVFSGMTVRQNVEAVLQLRKMDPAGCGALLERFGLDHLSGQRASTLSGGERRRLELARLLATEPRFLLLDEPFGGLDPRAADQLCGALSDLADHGLGVLITDHHVDQTLTICHEAYIVGGGRVLACGTPDEVRHDRAAQQAFRGWSSSDARDARQPGAT